MEKLICFLLCVAALIGLPIIVGEPYLIIGFALVFGGPLLALLTGNN